MRYMRHAVATEQQQQLAACLYTMDLPLDMNVSEATCWSTTTWHVPVGRLIGIVKADIELIKVTTAAQLD